MLKYFQIQHDISVRRYTYTLLVRYFNNCTISYRVARFKKIHTILFELYSIISTCNTTISQIEVFLQCT